MWWTLGSLLFLLHINDILKNINRKSKPILFADDTRIIFINSNLKDFTNYIEIEFESITTWSKPKWLKLHFDKTYLIQFTTENSPQIDLYISCDNKLISEAHDTKFLRKYIGNTVLENSYWTNYTQNIRNFLCNEISSAFYFT